MRVAYMEPLKWTKQYTRFSTCNVFINTITRLGIYYYLYFNAERTEVQK